MNSKRRHSLWQNKQALLFNTREVLTQGLIQGKSVNVMSSALAAKMGQSYKNAERLVRTETAHIHAESDRAAYKEAGVEQYEFMATLEVRTCDVCGSLDGKHFKVSEAKVGVNYPPIHPNCRCTTVEYDPDDALDWYNSGQPMPKTKTYEEWYDEQVARNGQGSVEVERQKVYNRKADLEQFEAYSERLGADAPSDVDTFQRLKYSKPDEWSDLKGLAGYMGDMKVNVLTILQNMVNGAIDIINKFIGLLNKIPGVSIDAVEQVTFATTAKAENEAAKQARADALNKYESDIKAAQAQRDATYSAAKKELADATAALSKTYANAKAEAAQAKSDVGATDWNVDGTNDVGKVDSVGSVGKIDSDVNIADEDLKFLRDVAEMRYVQNFVTLTPTVAVEAQISEKVDVDEVVERIESKLEDEFTAAAEGVYN